MPVSRWVLTLALLLVASSARAQDVASGPEVGKKVPPLKVFDATGPHKDKEVDYVADRKDRPTVYAFFPADQWDRPTARFLKKLDEAVQQEGEDAYMVAVWLTENAEKTRDYLPLAQNSLQFQATALTWLPGGKSGPADWGVNADARLTVVVAHKQKVAAKFGYRSVNETDVPAVRDALKKARGRK